MDYIKIPRSLIYKDRDDLKDFGVLTPDTMNYLLFLRLKQQALMGVPGARDVALRCYNNAYYVCTLILLEANDFPELRISDYVDKILEIEKGKGHVDEVCLASMAMACLLLAKYNQKRYGRDSDIWNNIYYRCTHYQWYHSPANTIFLNIMSLEYNITSPLSHTEFAPRDIIEVIEDFSERDLQDYAEYICERLALLEDSRLRVYETDLAIARIKGYQRDFCEDYEYNPKKDCFKYEDDDNSLRDSKIEDMVRRHYQQSKEAIQYYKEHYPKKEENDSKEKTADFPHAPETGVHQKEMAEMESKLTHQEKQLKEANNINSQQATRIKELEAEVERLNSELDEAKKVPSIQASTQDEWYKGEYKKLPEDVEFSLRERIVFFTSVLSLDLNKKYTVLSNLATFISELCNDQKNVGPFLSRMKKPEEAAINAKAAKKVTELMKNILPDEYQNDKHLKVNQLINNMLLNFPSEEEE